MKSGSEFRRNMNQPSRDPSSRNYYRDQGTAEYHRQGNNDHLEDFDSRKPDYASIQGEAGETMAHTVDNYQSPADLYGHRQEGGRDRINSVPGMSFLDGLDQSVNSKEMEDLMDYTFDASTITSNIESKRYRQAQNQNPGAVIDWGDVPAPQRRDSPPSSQQNQLQGNQAVVKPSASSDPTVHTFSSKSDSNQSNKSRAKAVCCGMGRVTLVLLLATILVASVAVILYLVLVRFDSSSNPAASSGSNNDQNNGLASPCCKGNFGTDLLGKEVCSEQLNGPDICCVVCDRNVGQDEPTETEPDDEEEQPDDEPAATAPTGSPTYIRMKPPTSNPTASPSAAPSLRATSATSASTPSPSGSPTSPEPSPAPTSAPSAAIAIAPSAAPTIAPSAAEVSTPAPTHVCCTDTYSGDFVGRNRCIDPTEPRNTCAICQVCPASSETPEEPATGFILD